MNKATALIAAAFFATSASADSLIIRDVHLVDIDQGAVSEPAIIVVRDGFIAAMLEGEPAPEADRTVDGAGGFLIPGLAEMHAHVPPGDNRQWTEDVLMLFLAHGVTTIRGMLGRPEHLVLKRELADGVLPGPRLITSGPSFNGQSVSSPRQAAEMVRRQAEAGYDFLKLHPGLWPEAFTAIVETANGLGIDFAGHVSVAVGVQRAIEARQATIDHLDGYAQALVPEDHELYGTDPGFFGINLADALDDDRIADWARRTAVAGVWNVPTQVLFEHLYGRTPADELVARPGMRYIPADMRERWRSPVAQSRNPDRAVQRARFLEVRMKLIRALHEAGAGILLGADAPQVMNVPGISTHQELALYVEAGLTPAEALATGTTNVARFFNESAHGCLIEGCVADLVLLEHNPLEDIANTLSIQGVVRAGTWYGRETLDTALDAIAERAGETGD